MRRMECMDNEDKKDIETQINIIKKTRCKCGAEMQVTQINPARTAIDLTCTRPTCGKAYHIPLISRDQLQPPGTGHEFQKATDYTPAREYRCIECKTSIPQKQAERTFEEIGCALCNVCEKGGENETQ